MPRSVILLGQRRPTAFVFLSYLTPAALAHNVQKPAWVVGPPSDVELVAIVAADKTPRRPCKRRRRVRCLTCRLHFPPLAYLGHHCSDEENEGEGRRKGRPAKETVILDISDSDAE
jgi:hypothetical protein